MNGWSQEWPNDRPDNVSPRKCKDKDKTAGVGSAAVEYLARVHKTEPRFAGWSNKFDSTGIGAINSAEADGVGSTLVEHLAYTEQKA